MTQQIEMSPEDLLARIIESSHTAEQRAEAERTKARLKQLADISSQPAADTSEPPEEGTEGDFFCVIHRGVKPTDRGLAASNFFDGIVLDPVSGEGPLFKCNVRSGVSWLPVTHFSGEFDSPQHRVLRDAVACGIIKVLPPGARPDRGLLGDIWGEMIEHAKRKEPNTGEPLLRSARTLRWLAELCLPSEKVERDTLLALAKRLGG